jgi:uncharacterized protein (TIGR00375 family)
MIINADLHIHSRFSGATSEKMNIKTISLEAPRKGVNVVATGDCLHSSWMKEITQCNVIDEGTFELNGTRFILSTEIEAAKRVHHLVYFPSVSSVWDFKERIKPKSKNLETDGRPNVDMNGEELAELASDVDAMIGPAHCVPPDTLIHTQKNIKQIKDISEGDEVLTHKGRFKKVSKIYRRNHTKNILKIRSRYFPNTTTLTSEHPVYVIKTKRYCYQDYGVCKPTCKTQIKYKNRGRNCRRYYQNYSPEWIAAKNLEIGDVILYPIIKKTKNVERVSLKKYIEGIQKNIWTNNVPSEIMVNKKFCRLAGYFLSEGSCFRDGINFSLGENELELIKDIKQLMREIFHLEPKLRDDSRSKGYELKYYSRILRDFFGEMFFYNAKGSKRRAWNKRLPFNFLYLPVEKQFEIFIGWWKGDYGVTTSRILMNQIKLICLRMGFILTFSKHIVKKSKIGDRVTTNCHDRWQGRISTFNKSLEEKLNKTGIFSETKTDNRYGWIDDNYIYTPITKIEKIPYDGEVYNLEVEDDSSYVTDCAALHNCFTPWTAMYAYYNSLNECYGDLADYISFVELGLSADSNFADKIKELHRLTFLTNSDCHSPHPVRLAREFNRFEVKDATFNEVKKAILRVDGNKSVLNVGLPPQEGKYHESACSSCYTHYTLEEAIRRRWKCSCGKRIKRGVKDNINEKADFQEPQHPNHRPPYIHLIPLAEIITKAVGQHNPFTQTVTKRWNELIDAFGNEINILLDVNIEEIGKVTAPAITEAIQAFREKKVIIHPGGGGQYGKIELPTEGEPITVTLGPKNSQSSLMDY